MWGDWQFIDRDKQRERNIIDQQNYGFVTSLVRAKTDEERLELIRSQPVWTPPAAWMEPESNTSRITDVGIQTRHVEEMTLRLANMPVSKQKRDDCEITKMTAEMLASKRKHVNETPRSLKNPYQSI